MGLREIKKLKVRTCIIENSVALFRANGFEATTVREIGLACELSEATFFNYFPAKDVVLSAWAQGLVERHWEAAAAVGERSLRPLTRALCDSLAATIEADQEFAARAWARMRIPVQPPDVAQRIFQAGQSAEPLRRDLTARQLAGLFHLGICGTLADWLAQPAPRGPLAAELRRTTDLLLDGSRRRNERVKLATAGLRSPPA